MCKHSDLKIPKLRLKFSRWVLDPSSLGCLVFHYNVGSYLGQDGLKWIKWGHFVFLFSFKVRYIPHRHFYNESPHGEKLGLVLRIQLFSFCQYKWYFRVYEHHSIKYANTLINFLYSDADHLLIISWSHDEKSCGTTRIAHCSYKFSLFWCCPSPLFLSFRGLMVSLWDISWYNKNSSLLS